MIRLLSSIWLAIQRARGLFNIAPPTLTEGRWKRTGSRGRLVLEFVLIEGVLWQTGDSPVSSFIKSDLKAVLGTHL